MQDDTESQRVTVAPAGPRYFHPWPDALPGLGCRTIGPFDECHDCATWSWVRYGTTVLCVGCARKRAT
jgi:hypothetical protein